MDAYDLVSPLLFRLPAETAHRGVHRLLATVQGTPLETVLARRYAVRDDRLRVTAFGQSFPSPVGVAAGFDKNARVPRALAALGFGHVEVGGVTAEAQPGNPRPRLFRLPEDRALINRMGFNNEGADVIGERLETTNAAVPVGVNIGKTKRVPLTEAPSDYLYTYERIADGADYIVVNVSSPNTPGLRALQGRDHLERILEILQDAGAAPLLVKLSPDLPDPAVEAVIELVEALGVDGIVATNTTSQRPESLQSPHRVEAGGLSGAPLEAPATEMVSFVAERTDVPIVGVGGVASAADAYRKIRAGASLVQLYTGLVYKGPGIARDINRGLLARLERDGFTSIEAAVGSAL